MRLALRALTWESPQDALDDVNALVGALTAAAVAPLALVEKLSGAVQATQQQQVEQQQQQQVQAVQPQENQ